MSYLISRLNHCPTADLDTDALLALIQDSTSTEYNTIQRKIHELHPKHSGQSNKGQPAERDDQQENNDNDSLVNVIMDSSAEVKNETSATSPQAKDIAEADAAIREALDQQDRSYLNNIMRRAVRRYSLIAMPLHNNPNKNSNNNNAEPQSLDIDPETVDWQVLLSKPCEERSTEDIDLIYTYIKHLRIQFLKSLAPELLHQLCKHFMLAIYEQGEDVFRQGDEGQHFYIILSGAVTIHLREEEEEVWNEIQNQMEKQFKKVSFHANKPILSRKPSTEIKQENHESQAGLGSGHNSRAASRPHTAKNRGKSGAVQSGAVISTSIQGPDNLSHLLSDPSYISTLRNTANSAQNVEHHHSEHERANHSSENKAHSGPSEPHSGVEQLDYAERHREWLRSLEKQRARAQFEQKTTEIMSLRSGNAFGEVALLAENCQRTATVSCTARSYLLRLDKASYLAALRDKQAQERNRKFNFIQTHPLFKRLSHEKQISLAIALKERNLPRNCIVVREGDTIYRDINETSGSTATNLSQIYFVASGELIIKKKLWPETINYSGEGPNQGESRARSEQLSLLLQLGRLDSDFSQIIELSRIEPGGYCNEEAFLHDLKAYNYTLTTGNSQTTLYTLNFSNFSRFIKGHNHQMLAELAKKREKLRKARIEQLVRDYLRSKTGQSHRNWPNQAPNSENSEPIDANSEQFAFSQANFANSPVIPTIFHKSLSPRKLKTQRTAREATKFHRIVTKPAFTGPKIAQKAAKIAAAQQRIGQNIRNLRSLAVSGPKSVENGEEVTSRGHFEPNFGSLESEEASEGDGEQLTAGEIENLLGIKQNPVYLASATSNRLPLSALSALSPLPPVNSAGAANLQPDSGQKMDENLPENSRNHEISLSPTELNASVENRAELGPLEVEFIAEKPRFGRRNSQLSIMLGLGTGGGYEEVRDPATGEIIRTDRKQLNSHATEDNAQDSFLPRTKQNQAFWPEEKLNSSDLVAPSAENLNNGSINGNNTSVLPRIEIPRMLSSTSPFIPDLPNSLKRSAILPYNSLHSGGGAYSLLPGALSPQKPKFVQTSANSAAEKAWRNYKWAAAQPNLIRLAQTARFAAPSKPAEMRQGNSMARFRRGSLRMDGQIIANQLAGNLTKFNHN
jgi:CRP-like cAMP-binding protein